MADPKTPYETAAEGLEQGWRRCRADWTPETRAGVGCGVAVDYANDMIGNRSVPTDSVLPHLVYSNVADAIAWLTRTFGFIEHYRYGEPGGPVSGAQLYLGKAFIMVRAARPGSASPVQLGGLTQSLTVFVDDVDAHFEKTKLAGGEIVEELNETVYGERQYGVEDFEGHRWLFSQHAHDVSPTEWGAAVATSVERP